MSINPKQVVISILETNSKVLEVLGHALKPFEISLQQFNVLRILRGQKGVAANLSTVQERMVNRMSNTTRIIDKLIDKEYVERSICKNNRRKIELFITEEGLSLLKKVDPIVDQSEAEILRSLKSMEQEELFTLLKKNQYLIKISTFMKANRPKCGCGNTQNLEGYCDGSHLNK